MRRYLLLGHLNIEQDGHPATLLKSPKGCALLTYLIVTQQVQSREAAADLLWEATSTEQSLHNLRQLLSRIRVWAPGIQITRREITFVKPPAAFIDLYELEAKLPSENMAFLDQALQLYRGDLLSGFYLEGAPQFNEWLLLARERLRRRVMDGYHRLCEGYTFQKAWVKGIAAARRWVALDHFHEEAQRWLIATLVANGQVSDALEHYKGYYEQLWDEFGVEPDEAITKLVEDVKRLSVEIYLPKGATLSPGLVWPEQGEIPEPGLLPPHSYLPYHRNHDFTGRQSVLGQLTEWLLPRPGQPPNVQVAAITGMGGLGKTQLAIEFAYRCGRYFSGGVYWLNFDEAENIAEELAHIGGERGLELYQDADQLSLGERVGRVQRAWQEPIPRLLIFDNCEDEAVLAQWLPKTGDCRILLTSRRAHWSRELKVTIWPLSVLPRPESVALLQVLASNLTQAEADPIAHELGDLPLALHLAGNFLQRYKRVDPATYLSQLHDKGLLQHPSLQGRGVSHSPTGHELHVARTFALSLEQLRPDDDLTMMARYLLTCAACFAPGEPLPEELLCAAALKDDDLMTILLVEDSLQRLISLGFLEAEGQKRVILHRLLAAFVVEVMTAEATLETTRIAIEKSLLQLLTPYLQQVNSQVRLPLPIAQLSYVTDMALTHLSATAAPLALSLGRYLRAAGEYVNAERYLAKGLDMAIAVGDVYNQGRITLILSRVKFSQGFHQEAQQMALESEQLLRRANANEREWLIAALSRRGWSHLRLGQAEQAIAAALEVRQLCLDTNNKIALIEGMNLIGSIQFYLLNDYEAADQSYEEAIMIFQEIGKKGTVASILLNQGECASAQGDYRRALLKTQEALEIAKRDNDKMRALSFTINVSEMQMRLGHYEQAVANLTQVINTAPKHWSYAQMAYLTLSEAYLGEGHIEKALLTLQLSGVFESNDDPYARGNSWRVLGHIAAELGKPVRPSAASDAFYSADDCFAHSLQIFTEMGSKREQAIVLWQWGDAALSQGDGVQGWALWQRAREMLAELRLPLLVAQMDEARPGSPTPFAH